MEPGDIKAEHLLDGWAVTNKGEPIIERLCNLEQARQLAWFVRENAWSADELESGRVRLVRTPANP